LIRRGAIEKKNAERSTPHSGRRKTNGPGLHAQTGAGNVSGGL
jgi:hypothetical protein